MSLRVLRPVLLTAAALLSACGSSVPTRFYTLLRPAAAATAAQTPPPYAIEVLRVSVPEQVDVPQLVLRTGDGELALVETRQWIAPVGREVRAAVSDRLVHELGVADVSDLARPAGLSVRRIRIDVSRFESVLGAYALLEAGWSVTDEARGVVLTCATRVREPVPAGYEALVAGHQRTVARLAAEIAAALRSIDAGAAAGCPAQPR
ncbi:MAG: PqiC family protein [Pseudomonadota bacterium]